MEAFLPFGVGSEKGKDRRMGGLWWGVELYNKCDAGHDEKGMEYDTIRYDTYIIHRWVRGHLFQLLLPFTS